MTSERRTAENIFKDRRLLLKCAGLAGVLLVVRPLYAVDLFKVLDPEGKSKELQTIKKGLEIGADFAAAFSDMDYRSEFTIGESLALEGFRRYGLPVEDAELQKYVNLVGSSVSRNSKRPDIPYYFVVVDSTLYNAFSCPGGIIFISAAMIGGMSDESELAGVLAHEVAHVSHRHALQSIKRAKFFEGVSKITDETMKGEQGKKFRSMIGDLQTILFDKGLDQNMEFEADLSGIETAYRTGYDPQGLVRVLKMLQAKEGGAVKTGSWFSTHPPLQIRIAKASEKLRSYPDAGALPKVRERFVRYVR